MANQITDNRTVVCVAKTSTPASETFVGSTSPAEDTEIFIEGDTSIAEQMTDSLRNVMYDAGSAQNWSNNVFYMWINCGIVGLLDLKANGGFRMRFAGATITDYFEVYIGGSDLWPTAISGGWVQFVVDIELAHTNSDAIGGTKPATSAIRYVGYSAITATVKTRNSDNTWLDAIWRLPDGSPGIIVEGKNGGTTDWTFEDINTQLTDSAGSFIPGPGGAWVCNTSIQFGINDTSTHGFSDTNQVILWDNQEFIPTDLLSISALGNVGGTTNVTFGVKTGTGNDATGAQGVIFQAASSGIRWDMDFDDPNLDAINMYGCQFIHGGGFQLDDPSVSIISSTYLDVTSVAATNSEQLRINAINPNTADGIAFMTTDDLGDIVHSSFSFSDGHAIEILSGGPSSQSDIGNLFVGVYGGTPGDNLVASSGSTDAMIYNNSGAAKTFNGSDGATTPSFRNGASATSDYENNVSITVSPILSGSVVSVYLTGTATLVQETLSSGTSFIFSVGASIAVDIVILEGTEDEPFASIPIRRENLSFAVSQTLTVTQLDEPNFKG